MNISDITPGDLLSISSARVAYFEGVGLASAVHVPRSYTMMALVIATTSAWHDKNLTPNVFPSMNRNSLGLYVFVLDIASIYDKNERLRVPIAHARITHKIVGMSLNDSDHVNVTYIA